MKTGGVAGPDGKDHRLIVTETQSTWRSTKQEEDESPEFVFKDGRRWRVDCRRKVWEPGANRGGGGDGEGTAQGGGGGGGWVAKGVTGSVWCMEAHTREVRDAQVDGNGTAWCTSAYKGWRT